MKTSQERILLEMLGATYAIFKVISRSFFTSVVFIKCVKSRLFIDSFHKASLSKLRIVVSVTYLLEDEL